MSTSFSRDGLSRADWQAHRVIVKAFACVVWLAAGWLCAINVAFYVAVGREFAPELVGTMIGVFTRAG